MPHQSTAQTFIAAIRESGLGSPDMTPALVDYMHTPDATEVDINEITFAIASSLVKTSEKRALDQYRGISPETDARLEQETLALKRIVTDPVICRKMRNDFIPTVAILIANTKQIVNPANDHGLAIETTAEILHNCEKTNPAAKSHLRVATSFIGNMMMGQEKNNFYSALERSRQPEMPG